MKFGQHLVKNITGELFFKKNHAENEADRQIVTDLLFFKKALK